jgi:ADP-ribose pyrophosphatase YjhB (NUDIX family)
LVRLYHDGTTIEPPLHFSTATHLFGASQSQVIRKMAGIRQKIIVRTLQSYWRRTRGLTMGAQGLVLDAEGRIMLVRPSYRPGWHLPGGGVERNETVREAMTRELEEESGVVVEGTPPLFSLYANFTAFPSDHVALFVVRQWHRPVVPPANREILESRFFARSELPPDVVNPVLRRLTEVIDGAPISDHW